MKECPALNIAHGGGIMKNHFAPIRYVNQLFHLLLYYLINIETNADYFIMIIIFPY